MNPNNPQGFGRPTKPDIDDILLGMAEECGVINFDISATKQALYHRLAAEAVDLVEFGETEVLPTVPPIHDEIQHVEIIKAIPLETLKAIMEIKE